MRNRDPDDGLNWLRAAYTRGGTAAMVRELAALHREKIEKHNAAIGVRTDDGGRAP